MEINNIGIKGLKHRFDRPRTVAGRNLKAMGKDALPWFLSAAGIRGVQKSNGMPSLQQFAGCDVNVGFGTPKCAEILMSE
jgi:hypothetical protein